MKRFIGFACAIGFALIFAGCSAIASLYTQASPLPDASTMQADCTKTPGSVACDVYNTLTGICNGTITLPIELGNINQSICTDLGYRTVAGSELKYAGH